jgi:hypothetical protein
LQTATLSFKYHPSEYVKSGDDDGNTDTEGDGYELDVDKSLAEATPGNYRLKYEIAQERGDTETECVREVVSNILGLDADNLEDALTDPEIRGKFYELSLEDDSDESIEITFTVDEGREIVDNLGDEFVSEELGKRLVELIQERTTDSDGDDDAEESTEDDAEESTEDDAGSDESADE